MKPIILLYSASIVYSVIRYVVFAPQYAENIPLFITNKGVSMAAALCFVVAFALQRKRSGTGNAPLWFRAGVFGAIWHIPMSLALLRPSYFKEFFIVSDTVSSGKMSVGGELVFCFGGLAAGCLYLTTRQNINAVHRWWLSLAAIVALQVHVLAMGYCRGLNITAKHAYLPPMWLLSAIGVFVGIILLLSYKPAATQESNVK